MGLVMIVFLFVINLAMDAYVKENCYRMRDEIRQGYPLSPSADEVDACKSFEINL